MDRHMAPEINRSVAPRATGGEGRAILRHEPRGASMDRISRCSWSAFILFILALGSISPRTAIAAVLRHAKSFVLPSAETLHDDLYAAGTMVDVQGTVDGDLVAAGRTIVIGGIVAGDGIAAARALAIPGRGRGAGRAAGDTINNSGDAGHTHPP